MDDVRYGVVQNINMSSSHLLFALQISVMSFLWCRAREKGNIQSSKPGLFWLLSSKQSADHRGKRNLEFPSKTHAKLKDFMYFPNFLLLRWCLLSLHFHKFPCLRKKPEFLLVFFGGFFAGNFPVKGRKKGKMTHIWPMFYNGIGWISDCYLADRCSRSLKFLWSAPDQNVW